MTIAEVICVDGFIWFGCKINNECVQTRSHCNPIRLCDLGFIIYRPSYHRLPHRAAARARHSLLWMWARGACWRIAGVPNARATVALSDSEPHELNNWTGSVCVRRICLAASMCEPCCLSQVSDALTVWHEETSLSFIINREPRGALGLSGLKWFSVAF